MPKFDATQSRGTPVAVAPGDIVQNSGGQMILVCAATPAADGDAVELLPNRGVTIAAAGAISIRCASRHGGSFKIVRGL